MCRCGTSNPAMSRPARGASNARRTALAIRCDSAIRRLNTSASTSCHWSISARGTTRVWPCVIGSIVKNATTSSSSYTKRPGSSRLMILVKIDAMGQAYVRRNCHQVCSGRSLLLAEFHDVDVPVTAHVGDQAGIVDLVGEHPTHLAGETTLKLAVQHQDMRDLVGRARRERLLASDRQLVGRDVVVEEGADGFLPLDPIAMGVCHGLADRV